MFKLQKKIRYKRNVLRDYWEVQPLNLVFCWLSLGPLRSIAVHDDNLLNLHAVKCWEVPYSVNKRGHEFSPELMALWYNPSTGLERGG